MFALLRQLGFVAVAAVACFYAFLVLRGPNGIPTILEKRRQIEQMKQENDTIREEIQRKKDYLKDVEENQEVREREIRKQTNKQKPNETIIYLPESGAADGAKR